MGATAWFNNGVIVPGKSAAMEIYCSTPFRTPPTVRFSGTITVRTFGTGGGDGTVTSISVAYRVPGVLHLGLSFTQTLTEGAPCLIFLASQGDYIEFDAEL